MSSSPIAVAPPAGSARGVDLVREQELQNTGPRSVSKLPVSGRSMRVPTRSAGTRSGELQAPERAAEDVGDRLDGERLVQAGNALEQHVAAGRQRDEQALEHASWPTISRLTSVIGAGAGMGRRAVIGAGVSERACVRAGAWVAARLEQRRDDRDPEHAGDHEQGC